MSLLEQNRNAEIEATVDDDDLEQAFVGQATAEALESSNPQGITQKRTREEIINELKRKRAKQEYTPDSPPVQANSRFKPIGNPASQKQKRVKKLSRKKAQEGITPSSTQPASTFVGKNPEPAPLPPPEKQLVPEEETAEDIFAGVGEYDGLGDGDNGDSSDGEKPASSRDSPGSSEEQKAAKVNWFNDPDDGGEEDSVPDPENQKSALPATDEDESLGAAAARVQAPDRDDAQPIRLQPLTSSKIKSITEYLDVEKGFEVEEKKRARREKRKGKKREQ